MCPTVIAPGKRGVVLPDPRHTRVAHNHEDWGFQHLVGGGCWGASAMPPEKMRWQIGFAVHLSTLIFDIEFASRKEGTAGFGTIQDSTYFEAKLLACCHIWSYSVFATKEQAL